MSVPSPQLSPEGELGTRAGRALAHLLLGAYRAATALHLPATRFGLGLDLLRLTGADEGLLTSLVDAGFVDRLGKLLRIHADQEPANGSPPASTSFALTARGFLLVTRLLGEGHDRTETPPTKRPAWNARARELSYGGLLIKRYRRPAPNQFLILDVFEELGWPEQIDDPLPPERYVAAHERLEETVKSLNRLQTRYLIRFSTNPDRRGVRWKAVRKHRVTAPRPPR